MKDKLSAFSSGFKDKWSSLAKNLRIFIITAISVVIVAAIVLAIVLNQKGYTAIYTGLDSEESSQVVSAINELGITDVKWVRTAVFPFRATRRIMSECS